MLKEYIKGWQTSGTEWEKAFKEAIKPIASNMAVTLANKYNIATQDSLIDDNDDVKSNTINIDYKELKNGWQIIGSGGDLYYREFGTGQLGKENPYPSDEILNSVGWQYGSGKNVLLHGEYINRSDSNSTEAPPWYVEGVNKGYVNPDELTWMGPNGSTIGLESAHVWYDTYMKFAGKYQDSSAVEIKKGITGKNLRIAVVKKLKGKK